MSNVNPVPAIRSLERSIDRMAAELSHQVSAVGHEVGSVRQDLSTTQSELSALRAEFREFAQEATRLAAVQHSETKVGNLRAQLDRDFGHYAVVRRSSLGLLHAFDIGNVSNETVQSVSEELMIQSPRYWLAPALVAMAAWSRDNQELADKSVRAAFERDTKKTSLFFALVLRRQGRTGSAVRWLRHYLTSLDPMSLTREFAVILEATSYDAFGPEGQALLATLMDQWCDRLRAEPQIVEQQVRQWVGELGVNRQALDVSQYDALVKLSPDFGKVRRQLEQASALPAVLDKYSAIRDFDAPLPQRLEDLLDDLLDTLVTEYDEVELPLRREVVYHESVIEERGNLDRARELAEQVQTALEDTTDVVSLQTAAAINPDQLGVGKRTQRVSIGVGHRDLIAAVGRFCVAYRSEHVDTIALDFAPDHSTYAASYGFVGLRLDTSMPEYEGVEHLGEAWDRSIAAHLDKLRFRNSWYTWPAIVTGAVALVAFLITWVAGVAAVVLGGAIVFGLGERAKRKAAAAVAEVTEARERAVEFSVSLYRDALAEFIDARLVYEELDATEAELLALIGSWPTIQHNRNDEQMAGAR